MGAGASNIVQDDYEASPQSGKNATYSYSTGETYYGGWENNKREGLGTYLYVTGDAYWGNWHKNLKSSYGVYIKSNHIESYSGEWFNNSRNGRGCLIQKNGTRYIGSFLDDLRHGPGVSFRRSGHIFGEIWRHGQLILRRCLLACSEGDLMVSRSARHKNIRASSFSGTDPMLNDYEYHNEIVGEVPLEEEGVLIQSPIIGESSNVREQQSNVFEEHPVSSPVYDETELVERSHVSHIPEWTEDEVQKLLKFCGLHVFSEYFQDLSVDGQKLLTLIDDQIGLRDSARSAVDINGESPFPIQSFADDSSIDMRLLLSLVRVIVKMRHKCEAATVICRETIEDCFSELEVNYADIDFEYECGRGGYGKVYKATWMHRPVACKVFKPLASKQVSSRNRADDEANLRLEANDSEEPHSAELRCNLPPLSKDFWAELSALAKLRHPNITLLLGVCLRPKYCILTEFVACGSLFDLVHRRREIPNWGVGRIIGIAKEISIGMNYLHSQGILHCDMKSSNILITESWGVKIGDFGLSFLFPSNEQYDTLSEHPVQDSPQPISRSVSSVSNSNRRVPLGCVGTHHWIAPEVLRGEEYSKEADVYSFGIILWEMVHRRIPFQDLTAAQVIALVGYGGKRIQISSYCPPQIRTIIAKCTARDKIDSRPSFENLVNELSGLHRLAVLEVEDSLDNFFGRPMQCGESSKILSKTGICYQVRQQ